MDSYTRGAKSAPFISTKYNKLLEGILNMYFDYTQVIINIKLKIITIIIINIKIIINITIIILIKYLLILKDFI